jgi:hypothetical protein
MREVVIIDGESDLGVTLIEIINVASDMRCRGASPEEAMTWGKGDCVYVIGRFCAGFPVAEVIKVIKGRCRGSRFLYLSTEGRTKCQETGLEIGADESLPIPCDLNLLLGAIARLADGSIVSCL